MVRRDSPQADQPRPRPGRGVPPLPSNHGGAGKPESRKVDARSLAAIIDAFLEWTQKHRAPDTYEWYRYRLQRFIERNRQLSTADLRPFHVQQWADSYELSKTSRRNYLRSVKRCLSWAVKQGYVDTNPIAHLEVPSAEPREIRVPLAEFEMLLGFVRDRDLEDLLVVTYETGCRPQESLQVEARHVDRANQRWVLKRSESKMKRMPRVVYLTDKALAITERLMLARPEGPLFRNAKGKPWTTEAVNCAFDRLQQRMGKAEMERLGESIAAEEIAALIPSLKPQRRCRGEVVKKTEAELRCEAKRKLRFRLARKLVPRYSLYALRHAWATNALEKGVDALTVAILMGHEDPSTLARVYQHLSHNPKHLLEQARRAAG